MADDTLTAVERLTNFFRNNDWRGYGHPASPFTDINTLAKQARPEEVERDANGEAMMCEGCGTTKSIAAILAVNPMAIACCPERKMVEARHFWRNCAEPAEQEAVQGDAVERLAIRLTPNPFRTVAETAAAIRAALSAPKEVPHA